MACPGGCIGGGGQPYGISDEVREARIAGLYEEDRDCELRFSHENPEIKMIYDDFLGKPLSEKAEELLHTKYKAKKVYLK
jgi:iron only hydrogenase large subunit-like protein